MDRAELERILLENAKDPELVRQHLGILDAYFAIITGGAWNLAAQEAINENELALALTDATRQKVRTIIPCSVGHRTLPLPWMTAEAFAGALEKSLNSGPSHILGLWDRAGADDLPRLRASEVPVYQPLKSALLDPLESIVRRSFSGPLRDTLVSYIGSGVQTALTLFWLSLVVDGKRYARWELLVRVMWQTPVIGPLKCQKGECDTWIVACA